MIVSVVVPTIKGDLGTNIECRSIWIGRTNNAGYSRTMEMPNCGTVPNVDIHLPMTNCHIIIYKTNNSKKRHVKSSFSGSCNNKPIRWRIRLLGFGNERCFMVDLNTPPITTNTPTMYKHPRYSLIYESPNRAMKFSREDHHPFNHYMI